MSKRESSNYRLLMRGPDESRGRTVGTGSLAQLRNAVRNFDELGGLESGSLLYIVHSPTAYTSDSGVYEGYYIDESGRVVKGYKKHPYRMSRGPYSGLRWGKVERTGWSKERRQS